MSHQIDGSDTHPLGNSRVTGASLMFTNCTQYIFDNGQYFPVANRSLRIWFKLC